jgi:hypothetical protein
VIGILFGGRQSNSVPKDEAVTFINSFNALLAQDSKAAYAKYDPRVRPEEELFEASASFFRDNIDVAKCKPEGAMSEEKNATTVKMSCPLKTDDKNLQIEYLISGNSSSDFLMLGYQFINSDD